MLILQPNDRYEYTGQKLSFTGPHKHDKPIGCEPEGDECAGCYYVAESADIEVRVKADARLKETIKTDARADLSAVIAVAAVDEIP